LSASSMIFLALNGLMFGINTGMICMFALDEIIEIAIKLYCLFVGAFYIRQFLKGDRQAACRDKNLNTLKIHWCIHKKSRGGISMLKKPPSGSLCPY